MRDIDRIFAAVRFDKNTSSAVRDIAHFAAHRDKRNQGLVCDFGRAFSANWRLGITAQVCGISPSIEDIRIALPRKAALVDDHQFIKSGTTKRAVLEALANALKRLVRVGDDGDFFNPPLNMFEQHAYDSFRRMNGIPLGFTSKTITIELARLLIDRGILHQNERAAFIRKQRAFGVYAIHCMHLGTLDIGNLPGSAHVEISPDFVAPKILSAVISYDPGAGGLINRTRIMATDCPISEFCDPSLQTIDHGDFIGVADWGRPLDLTDSGILQPFN